MVVRPNQPLLRPTRLTVRPSLVRGTVGRVGRTKAAKAKLAGVRRNGSTRSGVCQGPHTVLFRDRGVALGILAMSRGDGTRARATRPKTRILGEGIDIRLILKIGAASGLHEGREN